MGLLFDTKYKTNSKKQCDCTEQGCVTCPLSKKRKVLNLDKIKDQKIFIFAEAPGGAEESQGLELVGEAGQLLWDDAEKAGFSREDCAIQNVVRCRPTKTSEYGNKINRPPTKEEIWHCDSFNKKALSRSKATVYLILGEIAAKAVLGKEYKKGNHQVYWSEKLQGKVVRTYNPSYFLRPSARSKRRQFRDALRTVAIEAKLDKKGKYAFVESQNYIGRSTLKGWKKTLAKVRRIGRKRPVVFDLEYNEEKMLVVGVSFRAGHSISLFLDHPEPPCLSSSDRKEVIELLRDVMEDPTVKKTFHYGVSDVTSTLKLLGMKVRGFSHDTHFAEYIAFSGRGAYGLDAIAEERFPQFAGYKSIIDKYKDDTGRIDLSKVPKKTLILYNGGDCDRTRRIYDSTKKLAKPAIVKAYTYASFTVEAMQRRGPVYDYAYHAYVEKILPKQVKALEEQLKLIAQDPNFNPRSPDQVKLVLYDKLELPKVIIQDKEQEGTGLEILDELALDYEFPKIMAMHRRADKMKSFMKGYYESAKHHGGELRTKWWLAGTIAGRMRSGGDKKGSKKKNYLVNLQNIHGDPLIENLLVSDTRWRDITEDFIIKKVKKDGKEEFEVTPKYDEAYYLRKYGDYEIFIASDYSQIEIRILAHMSNDKRLLWIFNSGKDIHSLVGHDLTGRPVEEIANDRPVRTMIKSTHFALVYGKKPKGIHAQVVADYAAEGIRSKVKLSFITKVYNAYFVKYKGAKRLIDDLIQFAADHGYTKTIFGFRREINERDEERGTQAANAAVNSPIQGGAHMLIVIALAIIHLRKKKYNRLQQMVMEVHDALYGKVKLRHLPEAQSQFKELLEGGVIRFMKKWFGFKLNVPVEAESKAGFRLGAMTKYKGGTITEFLCSWVKDNAAVEEAIQKSVQKLKVS